MTYLKSLAEVLNIAGLKAISVLPIVETDRPFILCYHSIDDSSDRYSVSVKTFEDQIRYLVENKKIVSLGEMLALSESKLKNAVTVTFDDGYSTMVTHALPILEKYNIKPTLFVIDVSDPARAVGINKEVSLLTLEEIILLKNAGWEIGFHTTSHRNLTSLTLEEVKSEIATGKLSLEMKLGFTLDYFSYPYGLTNKTIMDITRGAGFKAAFSTSCDFAAFNEMMTISRLPVERTISSELFGIMISSMGLLWQKVILKLIQVKVLILGY